MSVYGELLTGLRQNTIVCEQPRTLTTWQRQLAREPSSSLTSHKHKGNRGGKEDPARRETVAWPRCMPRQLFVKGMRPAIIR